MQSKYCYPGTNILINKFNIKDQEKLDIVEADITRINLLRMMDNPIKGNFNLKHLQDIHTSIFKDIYHFAGKLREENISKGNFSFCNAQYINQNSNELFSKLKEEKYLKGKSITDFSNRAAYYVSEINVLHPFREGNGRTQREFLRNLSMKCGYKLEWSRIAKDIILKAFISSITNTLDLSNIIGMAIENKEPSKEIMKMFEKIFDRGLER